MHLGNLHFKMRLTSTLLVGSCLLLQVGNLQKTHFVHGSEVKYHKNSMEHEAQFKLYDDGPAANSAESGRRLMVIRVSSNMTFYIKLTPVQDSQIYSNVTTVHFLHENFLEEHQISNSRRCQYSGQVIAPTKGVASVNVCPGSAEAYAVLITEGGTFNLKPHDVQPAGDDARRHSLTVVDCDSHKELCSFPGFQDEMARAGEEMNADPSSPKIRRRRAAKKTLYIETAVFVDIPLFEFMKKKYPEKTVDSTVNFVFALLHQAQLVFQYRTMPDYDIKITTVKFKIFREKEDVPRISNDLGKYLLNFCDWQCTRKQKTRESWDYGLLLTAHDEHEAQDRPGYDETLGYAWKQGVCSCTKGCAAVRVGSALSGLVIAHEMGHGLGMKHDGKGNRCESTQYIMAAQAGPGRLHWSACSRQYMRDSERSGLFRCLENGAPARAQMINVETIENLPGELYNDTEQCRLAFGPNYKPYIHPLEPYNNICRELWCSPRRGYIRHAHPALEGTECAPERICRQGRCVTKDWANSVTTTTTTTSPPRNSQGTFSRNSLFLRPAQYPANYPFYGNFYDKLFPIKF